MGLVYKILGIVVLVGIVIGIAILLVPEEDFSDEKTSTSGSSALEHKQIIRDVNSGKGKRPILIIPEK